VGVGGWSTTTPNGTRRDLIFSMSHDVYYTIIGVFESIIEAKKVAIELKQLVNDIADWYRKHPTHINDSSVIELTPPEKALAKSLKIEWHDPIDWIEFFIRQFGDNYGKPEDYICYMDNCVFVYTPDTYSNQIGEQFKLYFEALNGKVYREIYSDYPITENINFANLDVDIICKVPNQSVADMLSKQFNIKTLGHIYQTFKGASNLTLQMPCVTHHRDYNKIEAIIPPKDYLKAEKIYLNEEIQWQQIDKGRVNEDKFFIYDDATRLSLWFMRRDTSFETESITYENDIIEFHAINSSSIAPTLIALINWLRSLGCTVSYTFNQEEG